MLVRLGETAMRVTVDLPRCERDSLVSLDSSSVELSSGHRVHAAYVTKFPSSHIFQKKTGEIF